MTEPEILRPKDAAAFIGVCRRQLYNIAELDPTFPRKVVLSSRCVGWRRESLAKWLQEKEEG
nr:hypothetical protein 2 [Gammaproteobacteria bacterium]